MQNVNRRQAIKTGMKAGAYAAPVILGAAVPMMASAITGAPVTQPVAFAQDVVLLGVPATGSYDIYVTPNNQPGTFTKLMGTVDTIGSGFANNVFTQFASGAPLAYDTRVVSSLTITATVSGASPMTAPVASFTSRLVALAAPAAAGTQGPTIFVGKVFSAPTLVTPTGPMTNYTYFDLAIFNGQPNAAYTIYPGGSITSGFVKESIVLNAQGNGTRIILLSNAGGGQGIPVFSTGPAASYTVLAQGYSGPTTAPTIPLLTITGSNIVTAPMVGVGPVQVTAIQ